MKTAIENALVPLLPVITTALGTLLCALIAYAISFIKSKTKNAKAQAALDRLDQVMEDAVKATQQAVVSSIKPGDDMAKALADAKAAAIDSAKSHYGPQGIEELKKILGWDDSLLAKNMDTKVESKVHDLKLARTAAGAADSPDPTTNK